MIVINLPWPPRILHPNERPHWGPKAAATKKARVTGAVCARAAKAPRMTADALSVSVVFSPPDNRPRDDDGLMSNCKAYFDGIADVIGVDDSKWQFKPTKAAPVKGGNVCVTISPAQEASQ